MKHHTQIFSAIRHVEHSFRCHFWRRCPFILAVAINLGWLAFSPAMRAVSPPPDGGYPSQNTAEGQDALFSWTLGGADTAIGYTAAYSLTTGSDNTAVGAYALHGTTIGFDNTGVGASALYSNTSGIENTATGTQALSSNTGSYNTGIGAHALILNTSGTDNTASGDDALFNNTIGSRNVATGSAALYTNSSGGDNTASGVNALYNNTASYNTATGYQAMESNTTGRNNSAHGLNALNLNTSGSSNAANGAYALYNNRSASNNSAQGYKALYSNMTGTQNTADGEVALYKNTSGNNNSALGVFALYNNTTGAGNIALGYEAGTQLTTGSNNIEIGNLGVAGEAGTIRVGTKGTQTNTYVAGISGTTVAGGIAVIVDTNGHLGTTTSSARYKDDIQPMDKASEAILSLQPVTFHYKKELDPEGIAQFGLVAEEVEKVNPDLTVRDDKGKPYSVRYEAVNAMLLNEFLKEHRNVEEQACINQDQTVTNNQLRLALAEQQNQIDALMATIREQAAQIQKVGAQLTANQSKPQLVNN